jgi:hypothetical protein
MIFGSCSNQKEKKGESLSPEIQDSLISTKDIEEKEKNDTTLIEIDCPVKLNELIFINSAWFNYYKTEINNFSIDKFELIKKWREKQLIQNNIFGDFDEGFNENHTKFIINSPDKTQYIDLDSYQIDILKNEKGELFSKGGEVDQEIDWVNRKTKEIKRLGFYGSCAWIDDAKWIDNDKVVLFGLNENHLIIKVINLTTLDFFLFEYPDENYTHEIRLKEVKFE